MSVPPQNDDGNNGIGKGLSQGEANMNPMTIDDLEDKEPV